MNCRPRWTGTLCGCCLTEKTVTSLEGTAFAGRAVAELSVRPNGAVSTAGEAGQHVGQHYARRTVRGDRSSPHSASRISPLDILACIPFNTGADRPAPGSLWPAGGGPVAGLYAACGRPVAGLWPAGGGPVAGRWRGLWPAGGGPVAGRWRACGRPICGLWPAGGGPVAGRWLPRFET